MRGFYALKKKKITASKNLIYLCLVPKGLKKVYIISILNGIAYPKSEDYYHIGHIRNQKGELLYDGITHVVIELGKWKKQVKDIHSNLDKLIHLMKTTHQLTVTERFTPPPFWDEKWLRAAIKELDLANMTADERAYAERQMIKAMHELTYKKEKEAAERKAKRVDIAERKAKESEQKAEQAEQALTSAIKALLNTGILPEGIAQMLPEVSLQQIIEIQQQLNIDNN